MATTIGMCPIFSPMKKRNKWTSRPVPYLGLVLFFLSLAYIKIGPWASKGDVFRGIAINEIFLILLPGLYLRKKLSYKERGSLTKRGFAHVSLVIISAFPLILLINGAFLHLVSNFIPLANDGLEVLRNNQPFFRQIIYLAIIPSIGEEVLFRGLILKTFLRHWRRFALVLSALLFAFFHFEIQNFLAPFLFGLLLAYIYLKLGHLWYVIYGHFLHNLISILFLRFYSEASINHLAKLSMVKALGGVQSLLMVFLLLIGILALLGLRRGLTWLSEQKEEIGGRKNLPIGALSPYILVLFVYIYACNLGG